MFSLDPVHLSVTGGSPAPDSRRAYHTRSGGRGAVAWGSVNDCRFLLCSQGWQSGQEAAGLK